MGVGRDEFLGFLGFLGWVFIEFIPSDEGVVWGFLGF